MARGIKQGNVQHWLETLVETPYEREVVLQQALASFAYGYPPDIFEFYFGQIPLAEAEAAGLRRELLGLGIFQEAGQKTLRAQVSAATVSKLRETYASILDKMDEIAPG